MSQNLETQGVLVLVKTPYFYCHWFCLQFQSEGKRKIPFQVDSILRIINGNFVFSTYEQNHQNRSFQEIT